MRRNYLPLFLMFVLLHATQTAAQPARPNADLKRMTWKIGGDAREAVVYLPPATEKTPAVVFAFHGHGGTAQHAARTIGLHQIWPEAVVVYPQGLPTPGKLVDPDGKRPGWQNGVGDQNDRDLKFFDAMLKTMKDEHHADPKRIYATGHSHGGFFTYLLWASRGEQLAAVAPVAAIPDVREIRNMKPKPVLHVAGERDTLVKYAWQQRAMETIRRINGCNADPKDAGKFCKQYTSKDGPPVITYIHPGAHEIPAGVPTRIAEFFKEHRLP
jgi:polyhydroxybutyrate depolymerase